MYSNFICKKKGVQKGFAKVVSMLAEGVNYRWKIFSKYVCSYQPLIDKWTERLQDGKLGIYCLCYVQLLNIRNIIVTEMMKSEKKSLKTNSI